MDTVFPSALQLGALSRASDVDGAYREVLGALSTAREIESSKAVTGFGETRTEASRAKEILYYTLVVDNPRERDLRAPVPTFSLPLSVARFVWMMAGNDRLEDIAFYTKGVRKFSDDGIVVPGSSYGRRMLYPSPGINQLEGIIHTLRRERGSRRATIAVYTPEDAVRKSNDIPCTFGLAFHDRDGRLHPSVVMRSNNAYLLLPYNLFEFSLLAEVISSELGMELGPMGYVALSMHLYESDYGAAAKALGMPSPEVSLEFPRMPRTPSPLNQVRELVMLEVRARHAASGFSTGTFESVWLGEGDAKLHHYWKQFYYILLDQMCAVVGFHAGRVRLQEFIAPEWQQYLRLAAPAPDKRPVATTQVELFPTPARSSVPAEVPNAVTIASSDSTDISREELERELEHVLKSYKGLIAPDQWPQVEKYRSEFIARALSDPKRSAKAVAGLRKYALTARTGEKAEVARGPAKPLIDRLEALLA